MLMQLLLFPSQYCFCGSTWLQCGLLLSGLRPEARQGDATQDEGWLKQHSYPALEGGFIQHT